MPRPSFVAATHPGARRAYDEDAFAGRPDLGIWTVADGAGGHQSGWVALGMIAEAPGGIPAGLGPVEALAEICARVGAVNDA